MLILKIIGSIIAIIILLFIAIIISTPVPQHRVIRCPIKKNLIRTFDEDKVEK